MDVPNPPASVKDLSNFTIISGENNELEVVPLESLSEISKSNQFLWPMEGVFFELFTQKNPLQSQHLGLNDMMSINKSNFNPEIPTRILIHGWMSMKSLTFQFANAYFNQNRHNVNFIAVNWHKGSKSLNYFKVRRRVTEMGEHVAKFIDFMFEQAGLPLETLKIIGHSLGAHIAGICK